MFRIIAFCVLLAGCTASPAIPRIVNGTFAQPGEIPYIVSLSFYGTHSCGGSILDSTHILTAAHCIESRPPSVFTIEYGDLRLISASQHIIRVKEIYMHPGYDPSKNHINDVAVLTLNSEIPFDENAQPVTLPEQSSSTPGNQNAVLAGWGLTSSHSVYTESLMRVDIICYSDDDCEAAHHGNTNRQYHICAGVPEGGKGQCSGDSGGPLTVDGVQIGVVSWSVKPCAIKGYPGVFARVANYVDWIKQQMNH
ncbi:PREDICTED: trypsin-3-like [Nicrophorus vespilloides]|uniref:Trypsin-3-like n=1 Tax=Nicrophorus vespilloides TaxID=110193 RepID=A0ABM1MPU3_NICVS|nr:PREDICTED: trypsin-3-like [Nicrophorus vespilloides]